MGSEQSLHLIEKMGPFFHTLCFISNLKMCFAVRVSVSVCPDKRAQTISMMSVSGLTWLDERVLISMKGLLTKPYRGV